MKEGARGNITKLLQEKLISLGYNTNGIDGIFGSGTKAAVIAFQKSKGLLTDGIVGENTWRKLLNM
ncbi:peptidoglycan-binding domain-containing protein [Clostridium sp.]|uniref:peptidoglycan-binding domain-containing protein n=1 Tax=Clostridium sp. TaxID=1506 RepID=UPI0025C0DAD6|nr:peptidoglycan-binding domain-containing protein [Clostridium sp.]MEE0931858.1 peptidoglycan-binding domain-containing protein [Clostridium sp.]